RFIKNARPFREALASSTRRRLLMVFQLRESDPAQFLIVGAESSILVPQRFVNIDLYVPFAMTAYLKQTKS
mgnify:CR=1